MGGRDQVVGVCSCLKMKFFHQVHSLVCCCIFISATSGQTLEEKSNIKGATVYTGVFDPNNIAIHVAQNFVNFAAGSVAWFLFAAIYPGVRTARSPYSFSGIYEEGRSLHSNAKDFTQLLRSAADSID